MRRFAERRPNAFLEAALSKPGHSKVEALTCFPNGLAKEFAFRRVNQRVRGKDL
jgi:hypothetical protein